MHRKMTLVKFHPFLLFYGDGDFLSPTSFIVQPKGYMTFETSHVALIIII